MKFRVFSKETGEDVTDRLNPCVHHSGELVLLMGNGEWRSLEDGDDYEVKAIDDEDRQLENVNIKAQR